MKRLVSFFMVIFSVCLALRAEVSIVIDKPAFKLRVMDGADTLAVFPVAVGLNYGPKCCKGDMKTPEGTFRIVSIEDSRRWKHDFKDGKGSIAGAYGPWFLRLSYGSGIGIHGTHAPSSLRTRATEGCIRLKNEDLLKLKEMVKVGTKVQILPDTIVTPWQRPFQPSRKRPERLPLEPIKVPKLQIEVPRAEVCLISIPKQVVIPATIQSDQPKSHQNKKKRKSRK